MRSTQRTIMGLCCVYARVLCCYHSLSLINQLIKTHFILYLQHRNREPMRCA